MRTNYVYGTSSGTANFFDSTGNDVFYGLPTYSYLSYNGAAYASQAIGFGHVYVTATTGNDDAYLYDSPDNDSIVVGSTATTLNLATPSVMIQIQAFDRVFATRTVGNDTQHVTAHDMYFQSIGGWLGV